MDPAPEQTVDRRKLRTAGPLAPQNCQLIAEGDDFQFQILSVSNFNSGGRWGLK
jgi:hypothetical protein